MLNKDIHIAISGRVGSRKGQIAELIRECLSSKGVHVETIRPDADAAFIHGDIKPDICYEDISVKISCDAIKDLEL